MHRLLALLPPLLLLFLLQPTPTQQRAMSTDCRVGGWRAVGPCSKTCGGGIQKLVRQVVLPALGNGRPCPALERTVPCATEPCAVECKGAECAASFRPISDTASPAGANKPVIMAAASLHLVTITKDKEMMKTMNSNNTEEEEEEGAHEGPRASSSTLEAGQETAAEAWMAELPSARLLSNSLHHQRGDQASTSMTALMPFFGQWIALDMVSLASKEELPCPEEQVAGGGELPIAVPPGDPWMDMARAGNVTLPYTRDAYCVGSHSPSSITNSRFYHNTVTAHIDASHIYGSDPDTLSQLRLHKDGQMKMGPNGMPPQASTVEGYPYPHQYCAPASQTSEWSKCYAFGHPGVNRDAVLVTLSTLFLREHNRIAKKIQTDNPEFDDERLFHETRKRVVAELQAIVYGEYLPALLGPSCANLQGYDAFAGPTASAQATLEFFSVGNDFWLSAMPTDIRRKDAAGMELESVHLEDVHQPNLKGLPTLDKVDESLGSLLYGLTDEPAQRIDMHTIFALRNTLGAFNRSSHDAMAIAIQRGRDHGLPSYNEMRVIYNLPKVSDFEKLSRSKDTARRLRHSYHDDIDRVDLLVGALAEDPARGSQIGPLLSKLVCQQFVRTRTADPYFYERRGLFSMGELSKLRRVRLVDVVRENLPVMRQANLNPFSFRMRKLSSAADCVVSPWKTIDKCSAPCGGGRQHQVRSIVYQPAYGGKLCPPLSRVIACNFQRCPTNDAPMDCVVSEWKTVGACTRTCGGGLVKQRRWVLTPARNGGHTCPPLFHVQACNTHPCDLAAEQKQEQALQDMALNSQDCEVSEWSSMSPCSKTCGGGQMQQWRTVTKAPHGPDVKKCPPLYRSFICNAQPCKKNSDDEQQQQQQQEEDQDPSAMAPARLLPAKAGDVAAGADCQRPPPNGFVGTALNLKPCQGAANGETCIFTLPLVEQQCTMQCINGKWQTPKCDRPTYRRSAAGGSSSSSSGDLHNNNDMHNPHDLQHLSFGAASTIAGLCAMVILAVVVVAVVMVSRRNLAPPAVAPYKSLPPSQPVPIGMGRRKAKTSASVLPNLPSVLEGETELGINPSLQHASLDDETRENTHMRQGYERRASAQFFSKLI